MSRGGEGEGEGAREGKKNDRGVEMNANKEEVIRLPKERVPASPMWGESRNLKFGTKGLSLPLGLDEVRQCCSWKNTQNSPSR